MLEETSDDEAAVLAAHLSQVIEMHQADLVERKQTPTQKHPDSKHFLPFSDGIFTTIHVPHGVDVGERHRMIIEGLARQERLVLGGNAEAQRESTLMYGDGSLRGQPYGGYAVHCPARLDLDESGKTVPNSTSAEIKSIVQSIRKRSVLPELTDLDVVNDCMPAILAVHDAATLKRKSSLMDMDDFDEIGRFVNERGSKRLCIHWTKAHGSGEMFNHPHEVADTMAKNEAAPPDAPPLPMPPKQKPSQTTNGTRAYNTWSKKVKQHIVVGKKLMEQRPSFSVSTSGPSSIAVPGAHVPPAGVATTTSSQAPSTRASTSLPHSIQSANTILPKRIRKTAIRGHPGGAGGGQKSTGLSSMRDMTDRLFNSVTQLVLPIGLRERVVGTRIPNGRKRKRMNGSGDKDGGAGSEGGGGNESVKGTGSE
ncbi:hypothetical protein HDV00_012428 [Rhizophlyctis rosea]|nr:hypothetical protein HDV00_012428 [Rhizophlyctis rosea]